MDTHSLNYYEEHFPTFDHNDFLNMEDSEGNMGLSTGEDIWEWEVERELNGDIAIIPVSSDISMDYLANSPPVKEDFQKILNDWHHFVEDNVTDNLDWNLLDCVDKKPVVNNNVNRSMGKKIDMSAQCYIVEKEAVHIKSEPFDIDEEPLVDPCPDMTLQELQDSIEDAEKETNPLVDYYPDSTLQELNDSSENSENDYIDVDTVSDQDTPILQAGDVDSLLEQFEATEQSHCHTDTVQQTSVSNNQTDTEKRKQILNALPQELIKRIKASSQRRVIPVIDPIPNKKRSKKINTEVPSIPLTTPIKVEPVSDTSNFIQLDHDYCASSNTPYPKHPKKDSGFESAEEEEQRNILKKQPTVKDANGRLMVSLLKVNTIQNSANIKETNKDSEKRKLNLEEYKKRRKDVLSSSNNSKNNFPTNTGSYSPTIIEDEKARLLKHQQKLQQMAAEVLKTPPRSKIAVTSTTNIALPNVNVVPPPTPLLPEDIEVKVFISIGTNTEEVAELTEIRPILKSAINKIDCNSLITSVIENIQNKKVQESDKASSKEHGEDKTIVYLNKCRPPVLTRDIFVQTDMVLPEDEVIQKHRRSSIEHRKCYKRRSSSNDSSYSCSSESSSSSRSRSRSPASYKAYKRNKVVHLEQERLREVEERRIVYIGGISSTTTKEDLRKRFNQFGPIANISIHFREYGRDNYGFVTFVYAVDAYKAIEHGNDDVLLPQYDLSFGGRRIFCGSNYSDLDNVHEYTGYSGSQQEDSFDNLLREAQAKLRKRK